MTAGFVLDSVMKLAVSNFEAQVVCFLRAWHCFAMQNAAFVLLAQTETDRLAVEPIQKHAALGSAAQRVVETLAMDSNLALAMAGRLASGAIQKQPAKGCGAMF